ncbi:MAG: hypothetical protein IPJ77_13905 [Planctomycetes bacterium]|nr:hypothetical protein [Planctomycetota bacterium]
MRAAVAIALTAAGCAATGARALPEPPDPPARTEWHAEPVFEKAWSANVVVYNHADASLALGPALALLQTQYDWLAEYTSSAPGRVIVHVGAQYPCGFSMSGADGGPPELFLQAGSIFDSQANYAHEMTHGFAFHWGALPHWFAESIADAAYADAEIALWKRRKEAPFLATFDRIDHRSYGLMRLRLRYGAGYFPRVFRLLEARKAERERALASGAPLETKNRFLLALLSEAAGEDLLPLFTREFGFDLRTRERQRGY